jgi:hypothetical protein
MRSPDETRLKMQFANLRDEDQRTAPVFTKALAGARQRAAHAPPNRIRRMALVAAPLLVIAAILTVRAQRPAHAIPRQLAAWSSPTAFLLETPGKQFPNQTPRMGEPLIRPPRAAQGTPR